MKEKLRTRINDLSLARVNSRRIEVFTKVEARNPNGESDDFFLSQARMNFTFSCDGLDLDIVFRLLSLDVLQIPFPRNELGCIESLVNSKIRQKLRTLSQQMESYLPLPSRLRCPKVSVKANTSVNFAVDLSPIECRENQEKTTQCGRKMTGTGFKSRIAAV